MAKYLRICTCLLTFACVIYQSNVQAGGIVLPDPLGTPQVKDISVSQDTIPLIDRYDDYINGEQYNPFDLLPSNVEQTVEYDLETDTYIIIEKIGDEYYRAPTYMSFNEYMDWRAKKQESDYFDKLSGSSSEYKSGSGKIDPLSKVNIDKNITNRLFGGEEISIEPQGNIDLTIGADYQEVRNPNISLNQQRQGPFLDFDMDIKINVEGNVGDKLNLGFNFDTNASFDFDRKIKLAYDSEQFSEDDIIKKIEAGNVSLPLRSSLIQGAQSLFGLKTELQFGHLRLTAIASQQQSEQESVAIQNGSSSQTFEIRPDEYDENRHFFISQYHRDVYEEALTSLPLIRNNFRVSNIEVWISDDDRNYEQNQRTIVAISDIGEHDPEFFSNPNADYELMVQDPNNIDARGDTLPENSTNTLFERIINDPDAERSDNIVTVLTDKYGLDENRDFDKFLGRKLSPGEYSFNAELGVLSLNIRLQPEQSLGVSYEYFYTLNCDALYKVGSTTDEGSLSNTDRDGNIQTEGVIYTKMLKSTIQRVNDPLWDLMMKNVYPLRSNTLDASNFEFDIFFENDRDGSLTKFIPSDIEVIQNTPLLNIFQLDNLNQRNDPQPDGIFDFVPGVTVVPRSGSIIFPVLEPFGEDLSEFLLDNGMNPNEVDSLSYPALYDTTVTAAREMLSSNKFVMAGKVESSVTSEYSLGAFNIPQGSVRVSAGSRQLQEGSDYEVDYSIGRVRIINESLLQQGIPINISYEDNSAFSLQQKTMLGLRAEYSVNDNFYIGATALRLFERPFTQKVNIGDDPINNRIYGLDMAFSTESPWLTKAVDKLPFYSTSAASNINFNAEVAVLRPGHSRAINTDSEEDGITHLDDFEGAVSGFPLSSQANNLWTLASTPDSRPEGNRVNDLSNGANRARLAWYVFDQTLLFANNSSTNNRNAYTRLVQQDELFQRQIPTGLLGNLQTFDLTYFPDERGPYNFDPPGGTDVSAGSRLDDVEEKILLNDPASRWAGIMRYMPNSDFQAANYEFIEFWLLNPFLEKPDGTGHIPDEEGFLTFHLGNVSEDILSDEQQLFENAIQFDNPQPGINTETVWGSIPKLRPNNNAFDIGSQAEQDLGLDGLDDLAERERFADYINQFPGEPQFLVADPCGDDFASFNDFNAFDENDDILIRYSRFNNPQGNSPNFADAVQGATPPGIDPNSVNRRGQPLPDAEDLNNNGSLQTSESYYEYRVPIVNSGGSLDVNNNEFIRDIRTITNSEDVEEEWYRFRIPISEGTPINNIEGFRSIQYMRLLVNGFETQKTFRMADFELIRSQWRRLPVVCSTDPVGIDGVPIDVNDVFFSVDAVGVEENSNKAPFPYTLPRGIQQERLFNTFSNVLQDEKSLSLNYCNFGLDCEASVYKFENLDLRRYKRLQMFVHAESRDDVQEDNDVSVFLRVGKDFDRHFYEYEIPLKLSEPDSIGAVNLSDIIWPEENRFDFALDALIQAKKLRNLEAQPFNEDFIVDNDMLAALIEKYQNKSSIGVDVDSLGRLLPPGHRLRVRGNPNLGEVKAIQIGVRHVSEEPNDFYCGEVWVNELRATGLEERLGAAGLASIDIQLADLGNVTAAGNFSTIGWGALDDRVQDRSLDAVKEFDVSASLQLGKFFPENFGLSVPFYAQYSKSTLTPQYDSYDNDITVEDEFDLGVVEEQEIIDRNLTQTEIKTINFTNVRKQRTSGNNTRRPSVPNPKNDNTSSITLGENNAEEAKPKKPRKPMPWDIENFSASYSFTEVNYRDPLIEEEVTKDYNFGLDYSFSLSGLSIEPFKAIKAKSLKILKEFNFNPLPNSLTISSNINRFTSSRKFREPDTPEFRFEDRRFEWQRRYDLNWNLTKALRLNFNAVNASYIDELRQVGITANAADRDWVDEFGNKSNANGELYSDLIASDADFVNRYRSDNLRGFGRNTNYNHQLSVNYTLPLKYIPYMDWVDVKAVYRSDYNWGAAPLLTIDPTGLSQGAVIQNGQNRSLTGNFNLERLYDKSKYLKSLDRQQRTRSTRSRTTRTETQDNAANDRGGRGREKDKQAGTLAKLLLRPLLALRSVRVNYREDLRTVVPGFTGTPSLLGLSSGFSSPGTGFVLGLQPDITLNDRNNWLFQAAEKGWITTSTALNQEVLQNRAQDIDAKFKIEPWKDVKIDVDFKKSYDVNHQEEFKNKELGGVNFQQVAARDVGSFELTYLTFNTLFGNDIQDLFNTFESYRSIISFRLAEGNPNSGTHAVDGERFAFGYGKQSSSVLIPAFLAAYTGEDPNTVTLDIENDVRNTGYIPKPNWNLRYDGLSKLPWFKDRLSSVSIKHGYSSVLRINNFSTDVQFDAQDPFEEIKRNGNFFSRIEIPAVEIRESFNPVIGVSIKTKSDLTLDFEYNKSRTLDLSVNVASELNETKNSEFVFGFAYTVKNSTFLRKKKSNRTRSTRGDDNQEPNENARGRRGNVATSRGNDMTFLIDFGFSDDVTLIQDIDIDAEPQPSRGATNVFLSPSWEYIVNQNLKITGFFDYNRTIPKLVTGNQGITSIQGGIRMGLTIQ